MREHPLSVLVGAVLILALLVGMFFAGDFYGYGLGYAQGNTDGYHIGYAKGESDGYSRGESDGYTQGVSYGTGLLSNWYQQNCFSYPFALIDSSTHVACNMLTP